MAEIKKSKLALFLVGSMLLITFVFYGYQIVFTPNVLVDREGKILIINEDETYRSLQEKLSRGSYVNDLVSFSFLARLYNYDEEIKPGRYVLAPNMTNLELLGRLRVGAQDPVNITFTNVRLIDELGEIITRNISITSQEFNTALAAFVASNDEGFTNQNVLTLFIPNTYEVYYTISGSGLIERMHREYLMYWNEERRAKAEQIGLTPIEVSILASIVQAEQLGHPEERPTIAGLYVNRLNRNMKLDSDPTLVYALGDFTIKRVLNVHKEIESPYNTYKYSGLPPGPINMPQISSIDAVLNYEKHDYLFMAAKEDFSGYHNFATSMSQHLQNASKYQQALTIEQRKARAAQGQ